MHDHLDLHRFSPATPEGDWLHVNSIAALPENRWYDAGDTRFRPGNLLVNARNIDTIYLVDKETKAVIWEATHYYKGGMAHSHESEMIEKGLPGSSNIILFDNGLFPRNRTHSGQTFIMEIDPITKDVVWTYEIEATPTSSSSARRWGRRSGSRTGTRSSPRTTRGGCSR